MAGDSVVLVERRAGTADPFGQRKEVRMSFADMVRHMEEGDPLHYLTTQVRISCCMAFVK